MRLTLIIAGLGRGGAERVMTVLASAWAAHGKAVTLLTFDAGETPAYPLHHSVQHKSLGIAAVSTGFFQQVRRNLRRVKSLRRAIRESHPDVVISFMDSTNVLCILATRGLGTPLVISERIDPSLYPIGWAWGLLRRLLYHWADALVCQTKPALDRFQALTRVRGVAIPNPIDVPFPPKEKRSDAEARACGTLVAMGRLVPQKGFDLLLAAFSRIADLHCGWKLIIYGEGPLLKELQVQAESLNLSHRVDFAGATSDPFARLCEADLFVFPSRFEGFGMALAEAMACGLPVVSFDCPEGPGQIVRNGIDGLLVPPQDVGALAAALDRLMSDAQERKRMAERARDVCQRFSTEKVLAIWEELLHELAPAKAVPLEQAKLV